MKFNIKLEVRSFISVSINSGLHIWSKSKEVGLLKYLTILPLTILMVITLNSIDNTLQREGASAIWKISG
jgi:hypothetical protein